MNTVTLSSKGQLVIPKSVRSDAHIHAGSQLEVRFVKGEIRLRPLEPLPHSGLDEIAGCLAKTGRQPLTPAQEQAAIKSRLKARNAA